MHSPISICGIQYKMTKKSKSKKSQKGRQVKTANNKQASAASTMKMVQTAVRAAMQTVPKPKTNSFLGDVGQFAGNGISKIFGLGAYKLSSNSLFNCSTGSQVPFMHSKSESVVFRYREYIGDISSSTAFALSTYAVNPGLSATFPYLSTIAACFQEYKFRGLVYEFKSTGATALVSGTNTAMGTISLVAQYRADAAILTNKQEVLNEMWSADGRTSDSFILPIECAPRENPLSVQYVRTGSYTGDQKLYDLCTVSVASVGSQAANVVGELWASYEVELFKPALSPTGGLMQVDHFTAASTGTSHLLGTSRTSVLSQIGCTTTNDSVVFPANVTGNFLITVSMAGGANASCSTPAVTFTNCTYLNLYDSDAQSTVSVPSSATTQSLLVFSQALVITSNTTTATVAFNTGTYPTNGANIDIFVYRLPTNVA